MKEVQSQINMMSHPSLIKETIFFNICLTDLEGQGSMLHSFSLGFGFLFSG